MAEVIGGILGGVGLLFVGMWLLSENLKVLVGPRLRMLASRLANNRFAGFGWGTLAGAITQSSPAVTFITISMLRSGLISPQQGYPIALGAQLGVGLILFIVTVDIRVVALFGLGVGGIVITRLNRDGYRELGAMLFGVAALLFGLVLIKESAAPLADQPWFQAGLEISTRSLLLSLVLGALLTFVSCRDVVSEYTPTPAKLIAGTSLPERRTQSGRNWIWARKADTVRMNRTTV